MNVLDEIAKAKEPKSKKQYLVRIKQEDYDDVARLAIQYGISQGKLVGIAVRLLEESINTDLEKAANQT